MSQGIITVRFALSALMTILFAGSGFAEGERKNEIRWEMDKEAEVAGVTNFKMFQVKDGEFTGTTKYDPFLCLVLPAGGISSKDFSFLRARIFSSEKADSVNIYYQSPNGDWSTAGTGIPIVKGWGIYTVDLKNADWKNGDSNSPEAKKWGGREGKISIFRLDPGNEADRTVKIDWVQMDDKEGKTEAVQESDNSSSGKTKPASAGKEETNK